ncbi:hypothetical protein KPY62_13230 [Psychrobacter sp. TAE2020]|uniref:hypothetical protein n=1 Tax=Psychrobacter sp. TAE2020 TaxID=2846762 RepID=UPI001C10E1F5|nr:hypothetical protein [Psychrobacter sp. TAE2020]MBU5618034.1 hypothetical protein [Psychrobacter sp. TAE2020]
MSNNSDKHSSESSSKNSNNKPSKKKWLALTAVGVALLLIPRRSSYQPAQRPSVDNHNNDSRN